MSDDVISFYGGPLDAPAGLVLPVAPVPVTWAHDWTRPLVGTAIVTPRPHGYYADVHGVLSADLVAALMAGCARLAGAWTTDADGVSHLLSIAVVL